MGRARISRAGLVRSSRNVGKFQLLVAGVDYPGAPVVQLQHETPPAVGVDTVRGRLLRSERVHREGTVAVSDIPSLEYTEAQNRRGKCAIQRQHT